MPPTTNELLINWQVDPPSSDEVRASLEKGFTNLELQRVLAKLVGGADDPNRMRTYLASHRLLQKEVWMDGGDLVLPFEPSRTLTVRPVAAASSHVEDGSAWLATHAGTLPEGAPIGPGDLFDLLTFHDATLLGFQFDPLHSCVRLMVDVDTVWYPALEPHGPLVLEVRPAFRITWNANPTVMPIISEAEHRPLSPSAVEALIDYDGPGWGRGDGNHPAELNPHVLSLTTVVNDILTVLHGGECRVWVLPESDNNIRLLEPAFAQT